MEPQDQEQRRAAALERLGEKRDFRTHVVAYVVVNGALIGIWAVTGAGYFWPIWALLGWGIGLALHAWSIWGQRPITEDEIEQEMRRQASTGTPAEVPPGDPGERPRA